MVKAARSTTASSSARQHKGITPGPPEHGVLARRAADKGCAAFLPLVELTQNRSTRATDKARPHRRCDRPRIYSSSPSRIAPDHSVMLGLYHGLREAPRGVVNCPHQYGFSPVNSCMDLVTMDGRCSLENQFVRVGTIPEAIPMLPPHAS
jgi:hypothetical protein